MSKILTQDDIKDFLINLSAAIELDQIRVDALPRAAFHILYDDLMWRNWRKAHLDCINQLLSEVASMSCGELQEITRTAVTYDPTDAGTAARLTLCDMAVEHPSDRRFWTAASFFARLKKEVNANQRLNRKVTTLNGISCDGFPLMTHYAFQKIRSVVTHSSPFACTEGSISGHARPWPASPGAAGASLQTSLRRN